jgi:hypothetical protein
MRPNRRSTRAVWSGRIVLGAPEVLFCGTEVLAEGVQRLLPGRADDQ